MLAFDPLDPFPLADADYASEREHSRLADRWLGLRVEEIESGLARGDTPPGQELWIGLESSALQTPYTEIRRILGELALPAGSLIVDLGAGYGRMGFVVGECFPELRFMGIEYVASRCDEASRCLSKRGYRNAQMLCADLASMDFVMPRADAYFVYDFGSREAVAKTLEDLRAVAGLRPIQVVGRGRLSRDLIERQAPWLSQVIAPRHFGNYSQYRSG